jgi:hypothetical protein
MNPFAIPLAFVILGATDVPPSLAMPSPDEPLAAMREFQPGDAEGRQCRDGNLPAVDSPNRQPRFERGPATPESGQIIYAVDRRIDGCSVILVKSDTTRQLRERPFGRLILSPMRPKEVEPGR